MSVVTLGRGTFEDCFVPAKGKNEWGIDTLIRKVMGARSLLDAYIASLIQGAGYQGYFLQSWEPDEDPNIATVTLNYKGLLTGGTPVPDSQSEIVSSSGSTSATYGSENGGKGREYRKEVWRSFLALPTGAETEVVNGTLPVYTTGATFDFIYNAGQTKYRYVSTGKPTAPRYSVLDFTFTPEITKGRIVTADGAIYGKNRQVFFSLAPVATTRVLSFTARHVIGSPFYECEDVVKASLEQQ